MGELVRGKRRWSQPLLWASIQRGFLGWHESGYLPHRDEPGLIQFVTFNLADAFPAELRAEWQSALEIEDNRQRRIALEAYLDRSRGGCDLRRPDIARVVEGSLRHFHGERYELRAWVVMPNHVHLLFRVWHVPMWKLVGAWKGYTSKQANQLLGRKGQFWHVDYWDTYMRDPAHEHRTIRYIERNPIRARLAKLPGEWPWSSARFRDACGVLHLPKR